MPLPEKIAEQPRRPIADVCLREFGFAWLDQLLRFKLLDEFIDVRERPFHRHSKLRGKSARNLFLRLAIGEALPNDRTDWIERDHLPSSDIHQNCSIWSDGGSHVHGNFHLFTNVQVLRTHETPALRSFSNRNR